MLLGRIYDLFVNEFIVDFVVIDEDNPEDKTVSHSTSCSLKDSSCRAPPAARLQSGSATSSSCPRSSIAGSR